MPAPARDLIPDLFAQEFVVRQAWSVSDYAPGATEVLPRLAAGDSRVTRPLISLIVPVWNDDELVVDLVRGLQVVPELAEWVVAAVQPGERLFELHRQGMVRLISCDKPSRGRQMNAGAAEARGFLLCFHHADSELCPEHLNALEKTSSRESIPVTNVFKDAFHAEI